MKLKIIGVVIATAIALSACSGTNSSNATTTATNACAVYDNLQGLVSAVAVVEQNKLTASEISALNDAKSVLSIACDPSNTTLLAKEEASVAALTVILAEQSIN